MHKEKERDAQSWTALPFFQEQKWGWSTPSLLPLPLNLPEKIQDFLFTPLQALDLKASSRFLEQSPAFSKSRRIGIRSERIQESLFLAHPDTRELRSSIVIPGMTEIDLLHTIHSLPDTRIHWELAVKFYLELKRVPLFGLDRWIGPSLQDTLGIKSRTIHERQLRALDSPEIRSSLGIGKNERIITLPLMRGILFKPWSPGEPITPRADESEVERGLLSKKGERGYWVRRSDLDTFFSQAPKAQEILLFHSRRDWIRTHELNAFKSSFASQDCDQEEAAWRVYPNTPIEAQAKVEEWLKRARKYDATHASSSDENFEPQQGTLLFKESPEHPPVRFFCVADGWEERAQAAVQTLGKREPGE